MVITNENFATVLRTVRIKKNLNQSGLGRRMGVTGKSISAWELGNSMPRARTMLKVISFMEDK